MTGTWLCQTQNTLTAHPSQQAAEREVMRLHPAQAVAWWCSGVEELPEPLPEPEPIVDRVLGHLGFKTPAKEAS